MPSHLPDNQPTRRESYLDRVKSRIFLAQGRRPYARGYVSYREIQLRRYVESEMPGCELPAGWGLWLDERAVEYPWFLSSLPAMSGKLLDAGSALNHQYVLSHEKLRQKSVSILTLAPEAECYWHCGISYTYGDLRNCCFRDDYFDWVVSISTLEHVGMDNTLFYTTDKSKNESNPDSYLEALMELRRVLKRGGTLYITLPFGRPRSYGWLQVFGGQKVDALIKAFHPASYQETYFRYGNSGWQISSRDECRSARYYDRWREGDGAPELAAAEAVVCVELVK
jgi:SAM-dependent methyltransferase